MKIGKLKTVAVGVIPDSVAPRKDMDFKLEEISVGLCRDYTFKKGEWHERNRIRCLDQAKRQKITITTRTFNKGKGSKVLRVWVNRCSPD
jgi:hypothetical protein